MILWELIQAELGRAPTMKRWAKSRSETYGQSNRMLAGMQRLGGERRYSRVKRAVENRKAGKGKLFAFKIFRDRVRERLPFLRGNPKGAFLPMWRMEG